MQHGFYHGSQGSPTRAIIGRDMDETALFDEICALLIASGIEIRTERFKLPPESAGGLCRLAGKHLVLLHSGASKAEKSRALLEVVEEIGLERLGIAGAALSPTLLSRLNRRGQMPWPHRSEAPPVAKPVGGGPSRSGHLKLLMAPPDLAHLTTVGLGGPPDHFERVTSEDDLVRLVRQTKKDSEDLYILGGGSNVVVADSGIRGTVAKIELSGIDIREQRGKTLVVAQAGENWSDFVRSMTERGYAGVECLGGIPGSVGATPIQNVGAYGQEVSQTITEVRVLNRKSLKIRTLKNAECAFGYRTSLFKERAKDDYIVLSVSFALDEGGPPSVNYTELRNMVGHTPSLRATFDAVVELRKKKSMVYDASDPNHRSCGSFFVNAQIPEEQAQKIAEEVDSNVPRFPGDNGLVKIPSAWLIERTGFGKGHRHGRVGLSTKHALCLVAHEGATSTELVEFAMLIRQRVEERFSIRLVPEPNFWGFDQLDERLPIGV